VSESKLGLLNLRLGCVLDFIGERQNDVRDQWARNFI
jgi:hypothetical protein